MAKRFTDTDKWKKQFIKNLPPEYKLFWVFLLDECDHAGIWHVEMEIAEIRLGIKLSIQKIRGLFKERVVEFDNGSKLFVPDFVRFQYGVLSESNKAHKSVINILSKYNLMGLVCPLEGAKDKDKDKDMVKDKASHRLQELGNNSAKHFIIIQSKYPNEPNFRLWGVDGVTEYLEMNGSKWPRTDLAEKFLRDKTGQPFNDFGHVLNAYQVFIKNQFK